jgi:predicted  nucleic acid-binding Zn-ribbon protein
MAASPQARLQSTKRVMMELKLLYAAARRSENPAAARASAAEAAFKADLHHTEARINTRLQDQQKFVVEMQHTVTEAVSALRGQLASVNADLNSSRERSSQVEQSIQATGERIVNHVKQSVDAVGERISGAHLAVDAAAMRIASLEAGMTSANNRIAELEHKEIPPQVPASVQESLDAAAHRIAALESELQAANQRIQELLNKPAPHQFDPEFLSAAEKLPGRLGKLEEGLENLSNRTAHMHETVIQDLEGLERSLQDHSASVESTRTAMAQTDDLVERVVEALESLQTIVLEQSDRTPSLG